MDAPLLSVIVPTYNRYEYLTGCVESFVHIDSDNVEFIIQDNTGDNATFESFLSGINDRRIKYFHQKEHISVMENCDLAVLHASGRYVCMIGDDDTVCPGLIQAADYCEKKGIESCSFIYSGFNWPDMTFEAKKTEANLFFETEATGKIYTIDTAELLNKSIKNGGLLLSEMPRLYHGMVSRRCLERIFKRTGSYIPGPSPDLANATAVCLEAKKSIHISDYLIVSGYGHKSARGEGNRGQHYGELKDKPWLPKDILERWNKDLPPIFSAETILAQSMLEALNAMGKPELIKQFAFDKVYAVFFLHHRDAASRMIRFCIKKPKRLYLLGKGIVKRYFERKKYLANPNEHSNYKEFEGVTSLIEAQKITEGMRSTCQDFIHAEDQACYM